MNFVRAELSRPWPFGSEHFDALFDSFTFRHFVDPLDSRYERETAEDRSARIRSAECVRLAELTFSDQTAGEVGSSRASRTT